MALRFVPDNIGFFFLESDKFARLFLGQPLKVKKGIQISRPFFPSYFSNHLNYAAAAKHDCFTFPLHIARLSWSASQFVPPGVKKKTLCTCTKRRGLETKVLDLDLGCACGHITRNPS